MATEELDPDMVLVVGPNNRHIAVHKTTQEALPDAFPLVKAKPAPARKKSAPAAKTTAPAVVKTVDDKKEPENGD